MNTFKRFLEIIDTNIILCLIPMIITLVVIEKIFLKRYQTKKALNVIRYLIISYTFINLLYFIIGNILYSEKFAFINRATGPYAVTYWLMTFGALILPITLFYRKIGQIPFYLIFVSFFIKSGRYFEIFVILMTSLHRDISLLTLQIILQIIL